MFISKYTVYTGSFRRRRGERSPRYGEIIRPLTLSARRWKTLLSQPSPALLHWRHRAGLTLILDPIKTLMHVLSQQAQGVRCVHTGMQFSLHEFGHAYFFAYFTTLHDLHKESNTIRRYVIYLLNAVMLLSYVWETQMLLRFKAHW